MYHNIYIPSNVTIEIVAKPKNYTAEELKERKLPYTKFIQSSTYIDEGYNMPNIFTKNPENLEIGLGKKALAGTMKNIPNVELTQIVDGSDKKAPLRNPSAIYDLIIHGQLGTLKLTNIQIPFIKTPTEKQLQNSLVGVNCLTYYISLPNYGQRKPLHPSLLCYCVKPSILRQDLYRIRRAITGVDSGYHKVLELVGIGYKAWVTHNKDILVKSGLTIKFKPGPFIRFSCKFKTKIVVSGIDFASVHSMASKIKKFSTSDVYKGKGVKYMCENLVGKIKK